MSVLVKANVLADFAFYRRSRLLLAFAILGVLLTCLSALPAIFSESGVESFRTLQGIFSELNGMLLFLAGAVGLFVISSHLRSRCLKMVFTKPCTPGVWLGSAFLSAVLVSLFLNSVILTSTVVLSLIWHVPVRAALIFISTENFIASVGIIAYLNSPCDALASRACGNLHSDLQCRAVLRFPSLDAGRHSCR
jgi:ABC-type transport system involved in multi-copper enzyme maturation permease subunit